MHAYDAPRRSALPAPVRPAQDFRSGPSATPIYDALYAEYVKSFRSLPGDRSGEEKLGFTAFGSIPHGAGAYGGQGPAPGGSPGGGAYSAYSAGAHSARQGAGQQQPQWQRVGPIGQSAHGMRHVPAGLPPAPRQGA
ncbi:hypothetical protein [Streptomyces sp. enrichment culture]|uniref:hypothetical protein n=1 Tax=Streptomyces sp. enrichment culture TaxID=1795815 RepID=UPI003F551913